MSTERLSRAAFARHMGRHRSWVTRLAQAGRLVEVDGLVDVPASLSMIAATAGTRDDVARRHREARTPKSAAGAANAAQAVSAPQPGGDRPPAAPSGPPAPPSGQTMSPAGDDDNPEDAALPADQRQQLAAARLAKVLADSRRVQAAADREELERDRLAGALIAREAVDLAMGFIGGTVRAELDVFADQVAPLVTPMSALDDVHAALTEACRNVQARVAEAIERRVAELVKGAA